jgi:hypothetical protein
MYPDNVNGTNILIMGLVGLFCCAIVSIVALVQGFNGLSSINTGRADPAQKGLVVAGLVCGGLGVIFWIIGLIHLGMTWSTLFSHATTTPPGP